MRLVSHVGTVNLDMALKHCTRCGADDETTADGVARVGG